MRELTPEDKAFISQLKSKKKVKLNPHQRAKRINLILIIR